MKSTVEPIEGNKVKLSIEVEEQEFEKAIDAAFKRIAREVRIPGFRPGKAPRRVLEARLGPGVAREEALRAALPDYYSQAIREHEVDVIAAPDIDITSGEESGPVVFDATVEVRPRVSVAGYENLRITLPSPRATEEEIQGRLDYMRNQNAELKEVERPAANGDNVSLNLVGTRDGEPVPGLTMDDYLYEVGSGMIAAELDEQLRGTKPGDILEFEAPLTGTGPDVGAVQFKVIVKSVHEKVLPEVTDEWANEVSEFETVEALRADIADRMSRIRRMQAEMEMRNKTLEALSQLVEEDMPPSLVAAEIEGRLRDIAMRMQERGSNLETYIAQSGKSEEEFVADLKEVAEQSIKADLAVRYVSEAEGIECTDDDFNAEIDDLANQVKQTPEKVIQELERGDHISAVRSDIKKRKTVDWLIDHVEIVDEDGQPISRDEFSPDEPSNEAEAEADDDADGGAPDDAEPEAEAGEPSPEEEEEAE